MAALHRRVRRGVFPPRYLHCVRRGCDEHGWQHGVAVRIVGANFGTPIVAAYGAYTAVNCSVARDSELHCLSAPGSGGGLAWSVSVAGLTSAASPAVYS